MFNISRNTRPIVPYAKSIRSWRGKHSFVFALKVNDSLSHRVSDFFNKQFGLAHSFLIFLTVFLTFPFARKLKNAQKVTKMFLWKYYWHGKMILVCLRHSYIFRYIQCTCNCYMKLSSNTDWPVCAVWPRVEKYFWWFRFCSVLAKVSKLKNDEYNKNLSASVTGLPMHKLRGQILRFCTFIWFSYSFTQCPIITEQTYVHF